MHSDLERSPIVAQRLQELPAELEPPLSWAEFQHRAGERFAKPARNWVYAALAAGVAAFVAGFAIWSRMGAPGDEPHLVDAQPNTPVLLLPDAQTIKQAEASERWLSYLPAEPAVVRVGTRGAITDLEDRIAFVDDVLSEERLDAVDPKRIVTLQHERARLVNSLAQVRYAETLAAEAP